MSSAIGKFVIFKALSRMRAISDVNTLFFLIKQLLFKLRFLGDQKILFKCQAAVVMVITTVLIMRSFNNKVDVDHQVRSPFSRWVTGLLVTAANDGVSFRPVIFVLRIAPPPRSITSG